jgi:hypothetical protein
MSVQKTKDQVFESIKKRTATTEPTLISPFELQSDKQNQFLVFLKPEVFLEKHDDHIEKILEYVFDRFDTYGVELQGAALFPSSAIEEHEIIDKHYGIINHLSKNVSKILSEEEKNEVREALGALPNHDIYGGHEALEILNLSPQELEDIWLTQPSTKVKSGFHARVMKFPDREFILVNGFHPNQLTHFTSPDRHILVMVGHSDSSWKSLREEMVGDTFPERAHEESIRGKLNRHPKDFGFEKVDKTNNVIHLSAGPTEGLFEIDNFLGKPFAVDIILQEALLAAKLKKEGLSDETIRTILTDKDLHSEAEHKDTPEVVEMIKRRYA